MSKPQTARARVDREIIKHLRAELAKLQNSVLTDEALRKENGELKERIAELEESYRFDRDWVRGKLQEMEERVDRANDHVASVTSNAFNARMALAQTEPSKLKEAVAARDLEIELLRGKLNDVERKLRAARRAATSRKTKR